MEETTGFMYLVLQHFENWPKGVPICVHAEGRTTAAVILLASLNNRSVHICHVATRDEIEIIKAAKKKVKSWTDFIT
jgi:carbamoyl-phosphate synthase/aspartate carbamoyltransferase/dihydroorotase